MLQQEQEKWKWYSRFLCSSSLQAEEITIRRKLLQNLSIIRLEQESGIKFSGKERFFPSPYANDSMLEIGFDQVGTKKVMANFASSKRQVIS